MDMPVELTALNVTPQGALLRWNPPVASVDNYVLTLTRNQGTWRPDERKHDLSQPSYNSIIGLYGCTYISIAGAYLGFELWMCAGSRPKMGHKSVLLCKNKWIEYKMQLAV